MNRLRQDEIAKRQEEFLRVIDDLKGMYVIVEGKKDAKALRMFGITKVIEINRRPLINIVEHISNINIREVVILTDFDEKGKNLYLKLKNLLQKYKVKINATLRKRIMRFGKTCIEDFKVAKSYLFKLPTRYGILKDELLFSGLPPYKNKRGGLYGKTCSYFREVYNKGENKGERNSRKTRCHRCYFRSNRRSIRF